MTEQIETAANGSEAPREGGYPPKAKQILEGARSAFLELGFEGASVDEIARRAKVSKPTLYSHFDDKRELFAAFLRREISEQADRIFGLTADAADFDTMLRALGRQYLSFLLTPFAQGNFRLALGETQRFPELGRGFYESGPALGVARLRERLVHATRAGLVDIADPDMAAHQFAELCKADLFYRHLFLIDEDEASEAEIARVIDAAVDIFMRAYAPTSGACTPKRARTRKRT